MMIRTEYVTYAVAKESIVRDRLHVSHEMMWDIAARKDGYYFSSIQGVLSEYPGIYFSITREIIEDAIFDKVSFLKLKISKE